MSAKSFNLDHTKSTGDEKNYRVISLSSGLEALLISTKQKGERRGDVNAKAAAAMSVQVGSFADPDVAGEYTFFFHYA
jgi:secreted Zn-dependent insulinase-like peptidase